MSVLKTEEAAKEIIDNFFHLVNANKLTLYQSDQIKYFPLIHESKM